MAGKGKGLFYDRRRTGWRGQEAGDPHQRGVTGSARRAAVAAASGTQAQMADEGAASTVAAPPSGPSVSAPISVSAPPLVPSSSVPPSVASGSRRPPITFRVRQPTQTPVAPPEIVDEAPAAESSHRRSRRRRGPQDDEERWMITGPMPGGPLSPQVLPSYGGHIAGVIWEGGERVPEVIECVSRSTARRQLQTVTMALAPETRQIVEGSRLWGLPDMMFDHIDPHLIAAFLERWQPDTNTFHLPFGEMTIMLHDVQQLLGLPVDGSLPACPDRVLMIEDVCTMFGESMDALKASRSYMNGGITESRLRGLCTSDRCTPAMQARAWSMCVLGSTLLVDKSRDRVRPHSILSTQQVNAHAWGTVTLAWLYRQLGAATRAHTQIVGVA